MVQKYTALEIAAISLIALMLISGCVQQKQQGEKTVPGDGEQNRITLEEVARVRKKQNGDGCFPLSTKKYN